jgi:MAE_28990/MAE_18760-like HEPN
MKIRTSENLSETLVNDLRWRRKELSALKSLIYKSISTEQQKVLLRSAIVILYAHWEGFVKLAANSYLEFVALQKLPYNQLSNNFIALAMKDKLDQAKESNKATIYNDVAVFFITQLGERSNIKYENRIFTSNLSSSVLKEIMSMLGLDYSFYESKENFLDEKLLARRNQIAHGNHIPLDRQDYDELHEQAIAMMENFRTEVENSAILQKYCRENAITSAPFLSD